MNDANSRCRKCGAPADAVRKTDEDGPPPDDACQACWDRFLERFWEKVTEQFHDFLDGKRLVHETEGILMDVAYPID